MTAQELAHKIGIILDDKKAKDIEVIDVSEKTILADYFVIASGTSTTHVKALSDEVEFMLKEQDRRLADHVEGHDSSRWILLDYGDVVVHVFHTEERDFYSLDKLWRLSRNKDQI
ncbi:MAG: ribosome silencing factor [Eubacteriales bacterium]|nr:ribosome silencing factor [Eubacteriales bacterium]